MPEVVPFKRHHLDRRAATLVEDPDYQNDEPLLTTKQVAEWLQVSEAWLEIGRSKGYGPPFAKLGPKRVRYRVGDTKKWLRERTYQHTSEYENRAEHKSDQVTSSNSGDDTPPSDAA